MSATIAGGDRLYPFNECLAAKTINVIDVEVLVMR